MTTFRKPSRYNHVFDYHGQILLFNGISGALMLLPQDMFSIAKQYLTSINVIDVDTDIQPPAKEILDQLETGHFVIDASTDELDYLRRRNREYRQISPLSVTIAPTMDCNLGCYYCFEDKYASYLDDETSDCIVRYVTKRLEREEHGRLRLHWFGGEPMLHKKAIDSISERLISYCDSRQIAYSGSMVSNGTHWFDTADEARDFVRRNRIIDVQFTFDGLAENHNKRRRYVTSGHAMTSFEALCRTVASLVGQIKLDLRINCDPHNIDDLYALVDFFAAEGWLYPGSNVWPYAVQVLPVSETCDFLHGHKVDNHSFNQVNNAFRRYVGRYLDYETYARYLYPRSLKVICDAMSPNAIMIGPDGYLYKCSGEMGDHKRSHGQLRDAVAIQERGSGFVILNNFGSNFNDYDSFDVFSQPTCSTCKYLPQCMSGCPKQQLEKYRPDGNKGNIDAFKQYWDESLEAMVVTYADLLLEHRGVAN